MKIPKSHPRYESLMRREKIVKGIESGITSMHGLIAQGRGEAFDYLIKERTTKKAKQQIKKAAKLLLKAKYQVISVNGNTAVLVPRELIKLSKIIPAKLEINLFHKSKEREQRIKEWLVSHGAKEVLMPEQPLIKYIEHNRRFCNPNGIAKADVVFVPLEDGDRCEALIRMGKKVITVDLNPMSRTAKKATITIVDNITRALPLLIQEIESIKK